MKKQFAAFDLLHNFLRERKILVKKQRKSN